MDKKPVSSEIQEICRSVYRNYKATLELIMENAPTISALVKIMSEKINTRNTPFFAHYGSYWMSMSPRRWLDEGLFKETTKYSSVRIQYEYYPEKLYLVLVFPNEEEYKDKIDYLSAKLFGKGAEDIDSWKNWGKLFYTFDVLDDFVPENLGQGWDSSIAQLRQKIESTCEKVFPELEEVLR